MGAERITSGITGLDKVLGGGFLKGSIIDLAGSEGTFKSTFGLQFAVEGIRNKEKVVYVSFEEPKESFKATAEMFGWDKEFEEIDFREIDLDEFFETVRSQATKGDDPNEVLAGKLLKQIDTPDRVVIDTITTIALYGTKTTLRMGARDFTYLTPSKGDTRSMLYHIANKLRSKNITSLMLAEAGEGELYLPEEILKYVSDAKVELKRSTLGTQAPRTMTIHKVRHTNHPLDELVLNLGKNGLEVKPLA